MVTGTGEHDKAVRLRRAGSADAMAVAEVHVRSWQVGYRDLLPGDYLARLDPADRSRRYTCGADAGEGAETVLAERHGQVLGFATIGPARDDDCPAGGELYALYVHPDRWSRGIGNVLISDARRRLTAAGFTTATLWVLVGNARAQRFYRMDGWSADGSSRQQPVHGIVVDEVRYLRNLP